MVGETDERRIHRRLLDIREHDVHAFGEERTREREPDAARAAGDERCFTDEPLHPRLPRSS
jgi:hypothetical protein